MMGNENACWKCNCFMSDKKDFDTGYGVCMHDSDKFESYINEIYEESDFSSCMELYDEVRIYGDINDCKNFEELEMLEIDEDVSSEEMRVSIVLQHLQTKDVYELEQQLYSKNSSENRNAIKESINLLYTGNNMAYEALLNYFVKSDVAKTIEDVNMRVDVIGALQFKAREEKLVEYFINELLKTPSNNTTRKIYTQIFKYFEKCPIEIVREPLMSYLEKSKCSYKIKSKVLGVHSESHYNKPQ